MWPPIHNKRFRARHVIAHSILLIVLASACGTSDVQVNTTVGAEQGSSTPTTEAQYSIVADASYLGFVFGTVLPLPAEDDLGEWKYATGPVSASGSPGHGFVMYRRYNTPDGREDLAVMMGPSGGVDAVRLTGDTNQVHLGLSCDDGIIVLASNDFPLDSTRHELSSAIRAWRAGPDGAIEEFDPATGESGGC